MFRWAGALVATGAALAAAMPAVAGAAQPLNLPPTHVGFYTVHPRVGRSTYFSLSASWPHTQKPLRVIAKVHPAGQACGADPRADGGAPLGSAWLARNDHHVVWKEWTPQTSGAYTVCTWLGTPVIATSRSIAGAVVFLASPAAALITGHTMLIDGGWTVR